MREFSLMYQAYWFGASDTTFISGPLGIIRESAAPILLPIGRGNKYRPMTITPITPEYFYFEASYYDTAYQYMLPLEDSLTGICQSGYYYLNTNGGTYPNYKMTLSWAEDKVVTNLSKLRVANWNGEGWYNEGNTGTSGSLEAGTVTSKILNISSGVFAVGSTDGELPQSSIINITSIIEGFYNTSSNRLNIRDTVKAYLRNITSPYSIVDSSKAVIDSLTCSGKFLFRNAPTGNYYLVLKHRNSIETWSKTGGIAFTKGSTTNYDFTSSLSQAFGNNLKPVAGKFCTFSGDVNQDGLAIRLI